RPPQRVRARLLNPLRVRPRSFRSISRGNCRTPPRVSPRFRERSQISLLHLVDAEAALLEERRNVARDVTAFEQPMGDRLGPALPTLRPRIGREAVLEEDEPSLRLQ